MTDIESALMDIARQVWQDDAEPDAGIVDRAARRFVATAGVIEDALGDGDYLVGNAFSVADIVVGSVLGFARTGELTELPAGVVPYVDRLEARPARQRAVASPSPRRCRPARHADEAPAGGDQGDGP